MRTGRQPDDRGGGVTAPAAVLARLTVSGLLGRRRALVLTLLPVVLLGFAVLFRAVASQGTGAASTVVGVLGLGTVVPLLCVVVGTGVIGPEIEDGSVVYLLSKPLRRSVIVLSKLAVAVLTGWAFLVPALLVAGLVLVGGADRLAVAYALAAALAVVCYCALFLLLAVITRNAVVVGLLYALIWETTIAGLVPGARALSVRQWALSAAEAVVGDRASSLGIESDVGLVPGLLLLVGVTVAAAAYATARLRSLTLGGD